MCRSISPERYVDGCVVSVDYVRMYSVCVCV